MFLKPLSRVRITPVRYSVRQLSSTSTHPPPPTQSPSATSTATGSLIQQEKKQKKQTVEEADEELRQKLEAISGEGGEAGLELEAGKPVAMKRGVRENMFRVI